MSGRDALADIVEIHVAHRDLASVNVLVPPDPDSVCA
jgi:hypothetical protein